MSQETHQKLDDIRQSVLKLRDVSSIVFDELQKKISDLLAMVEIQKKLNELARMIREGYTVPVRRINYNIRKLAEDDEACQSRWLAMRELNCPAILFCTMAFNGLFSLPDKQYECLVENVQDYIQVQELPSKWIARDEIRRVVANTPRRESTQSFLQNYHVLEIQMTQGASSEEKHGTKRKQNEVEQLPSANQESSIREMQTKVSVQIGRKIDYKCSEAPINLMPFLGKHLYDAVAASNQWKWERKVGGETSDCMNAMVPEDRNQDISITLSVGYKEGLEVIAYVYDVQLHPFGRYACFEASLAAGPHYHKAP